MNPGQSNRYKAFKARRGGFYYKNRGSGDGSTGRSANSEYRDNRSKKAPVKETKLQLFLEKNCPYQGWNLYFPKQDYDENSDTVHKIRAVEYFFKNNQKLYNASTIEESRYFSLDINLLFNDEELKASWATLESDLRDNPTHTISCIGLAIHQVVFTKLKEELRKEDIALSLEEKEIHLPIIQTRILNFRPIIMLKNLKSNYFGKLITVKGTIIRVGNVKLVCTRMAFQCDTCESIQCLKQSDGIHTVPTSCTETGCRSKSFTPLLSSALTQTINWQCVRLQEIVSDENREGGRVPRSIDCELTCDLVDSCSPGDVAILTGIIKIRNNEEGVRQKNTNIFFQYMDVVCVSNCKKTSDTASELDFSMKNYYAIKEIHSERNLFRLIVQSLCPSIFGHEIVKAGLILAMFGGCQRYEECRADPHVLIVGDPGLGKSRMLQACASVAPRGIYVCGNTSTVSGLTVTLMREGGGDYVLEAGALVLSNQGCCCIDEFDKMTSQHQALLEAMEQQTVSIAKSGVVCALPCRTSVLAAANPVGGHYNRARTVSENLKLGPSLLSRFDLVFILMDQPNVQTDSLLSDHVMALHSGCKGSTFYGSSTFGENSLPVLRESLLDRLKAQPAEELDLIPHQVLKKYIAYAKRYVRPKLTDEASEILMKFYIDLRRCHQDSDSTPVTPRQLESLIRFTEARAKLELREEARAADAEDVIEILRHSLLDMFSDDSGELDFQRSQNGSGMSSRSQAKLFISALHRRSELERRSVFSKQELDKIAQSHKLKIKDFSNFLSSLNVQGYLLKKGNQLYQLVSAD